MVDFLTIDQPHIPSPEAIYDIPHLPTLDFRDPAQPLYNGSLRRLFHPDWVRAAKAIKRAEMLQRPDFAHTIASASGSTDIAACSELEYNPRPGSTTEVERHWLNGAAADHTGEEVDWMEEGRRPLDLMNWENDIVYNALEKQGNATVTASQDGRKKEAMAIRIRRPE